MSRGGRAAGRGAAAIAAVLLIGAAAPEAGRFEVAQFRAESQALEPLLETPWVKEFVRASAALPATMLRRLYHDASKTAYYTETEAATIRDEGLRGSLTEMTADTEFYYNTRYGTPLAYARPLDLVGRRGFAPAGRRILDFGYGGVGQLRLLASLGATAVGVDVDPMLRVLYSRREDQGAVPGWNVPGGSLLLLDGRYPAEASIKEAVGGGYALVISKNVLKRGYVHPERPVPERQRVVLGVEDEVFLKTLFDALAPGGLVMVYNICPAPDAPGKPYVPWADGRSPFTRAQWEAAGFRLHAFDEDDTRAARAMGRALGWASGPKPIHLERDLFALYTLAGKPEAR